MTGDPSHHAHHVTGEPEQLKRAAHKKDETECFANKEPSEFQSPPHATIMSPGLASGKLAGGMPADFWDKALDGVPDIHPPVLCEALWLIYYTAPDRRTIIHPN